MSATYYQKSLMIFTETEWTDDDAEALWKLTEDKLLFAKVLILLVQNSFLACLFS